MRFDAGSRAAYAHDASNYRQAPIGVVVPLAADAAVEARRSVPRPRHFGVLPRLSWADRARG